MSPQDLLSLLPLLIVAATLVTGMLAIALHRSHPLTFWISVLGLALALASLLLASQFSPRHVTPLFVWDSFGIFYSGLVLAGGLVAVSISHGYLEKMEGRKDEYYLLLLLATLGAASLVISNHFVSFFLGTELLGLSLYPLVAYTPGQRSRVEAGLKYLILLGAASAILLFGMALIYAGTGTMQFDQMSLSAAPTANEGSLVVIGLGMLVAGISFDLALVPFHMWTPDVYQAAPSPVTGFIATVSKGGMFALMLRFFSSVSLNPGGLLWNEFALIAIASMLLGNIVAIVQTSVKRMLAYSSIAHLGYLMVAFLAGIPLSSPSAMGFYWVVYFLMTLLAFGVIAQLSDPLNELDALEGYRALFHQRPWPAVLLTLALLSLAGLPPVGGLVGKIYLVAVGVQASLWLLLAALIIGSVIGIFYYMRLALTMFRQPGSEGKTQAAPGGWGAGLVLSVLGGMLLLLGLYPSPLINWISHLVTVLGPK